MIFLITIFVLFLVCSVFAAMSWIYAEKENYAAAHKYYNFTCYSWCIIIVLCLINLI